MSTNQLFFAAACLKRGELVVFPTETVYGLGAPVFNCEAIKQIFKIKGRPADNPLIAHIASIEQAELLAEHLPPPFYQLAQQFWPGPLTLVVKKNNKVPAIVSAGHPTIAIRMPKHPLALDLIKAVGEPLVAPSANLSGRPSPTRVRDVLDDLEGKVSCILDGGECEVGIESTVLSLVGVPTILRPGAISRETLEQALGMKIGRASLSSPIHSPGMKYRHYAPNATVRIVTEKEGLKGGFLLSALPVEGQVVRPLDTKTFYAHLREADRLGFAEITIYCDPSIQENEGLMNRILKAAGHE